MERQRRAILELSGLAIVIFLVQQQQIKALNLEQCVAPLGMESERIADDQIKASSSYDNPSVGPQNARLGHEDGGGAWCPRQQVKKDVYEYLEVDLLSLHVISAVETQGRFGNGQGQEYAEFFMLEYQRDTAGEWVTYRNRKGDKLLQGNTNTYVRNEQKLEPPIIAQKLRFIPQSVYARTICMRVEVFGCPWTEGMSWYSMPQGEARGPDVQLYDWTYDGVIEQNHLYLGLGQLTDGRVGPDNFRLEATVGGHKGYDWVGWKNESHQGQIDLTFKFDKVRKFSALYIHCNNLFTKEVQVFASAAVYYSIGGRYYLGEPVQYFYTPDTVMESARNVTVKLDNRIGRYVKVILTFASRWMLISEVSFDSEPLQGNFTPEEAPPELPVAKSMTPNSALDGQFFHIFHPTGFSLKTRNLHEIHGHKTLDLSLPPTTEDYLGLIVGVVCGLIFLAMLCLAIIVKKTRNKKHNFHSKFSSDFFSLEKNLPFDLKNIQADTLRSNGENLYGSILSEEPEKNSIYHEPHEVMMKHAFYNSQQTIMAKEYHNTLCSREYAVPEMSARSPYMKPRNVCSPRSHFQTGFPTSTCSSARSNANTKSRLIPEISRESLKFIEKIGEGQFGEVHLCAAENVPGLNCTNHCPTKLVAVKLLRPNVSCDTKSDFRKEIEILGTLEDPNLIQVLGVCTREDPLCMIVEYMERGDLNQFLKDHVPESPLARHMNQKSLNYGTLVFMATQISSGMQYLENLNYVHRDLATRNCLVGDKFSIKISDFGMSRRLYASDYYRIEGKAILPIRWMSWESILLGKFTTKSDVWSFAVTLWEMLTFARQQPYDDFSDEQVIENASRCYHSEKQMLELPQPAICPKEIYDLMRECWQRHDEDRPNFREIHLFLQRKNLGFTLDT